MAVAAYAVVAVAGRTSEEFESMLDLAHTLILL